MNVTVLSYRAPLPFELTSCCTLLPNLADIARAFVEGFEAPRERVDALAAQMEG